MLKVACSGPVSRTRNLSITSPILYQLDHCTHYSVLRILVKLGKSHHFFVIFWLSNGHLIGWLILLFFIFFYFLLAFVVNKDVQIGSVLRPMHSVLYRTTRVHHIVSTVIVEINVRHTGGPARH